MCQEHRYHCLVEDLTGATDANMEDGPGAGERPALKEDLREEVTFQSRLPGCFAQGSPTEEGERGFCM